MSAASACTPARNDAEIFRRAFSFVRDPKRLLQNGFTREPEFDAERPVPPERACSMGWLSYCGAEYYGGPNSMRAIFDRAARDEGCMDGITGYNDEHTHAEIVALWRRIGLRQGWITTEDELARAA